MSDKIRGTQSHPASNHLVFGCFWDGRAYVLAVKTWPETSLDPHEIAQEELFNLSVPFEGTGRRLSTLSLVRIGKAGKIFLGMATMSSAKFFFRYKSMAYYWVVSSNNPVETNPAGEHGANCTLRHRVKIGDTTLSKGSRRRFIPLLDLMTNPIKLLM